MPGAAHVCVERVHDAGVDAGNRVRLLSLHFEQVEVDLSADDNGAVGWGGGEGGRLLALLPKVPTHWAWRGKKERMEYMHRMSQK